MNGSVSYDLLDDAARVIAFEEGFRERPYIDTEGYPTVGYGLRIGDKDTPIDLYAGFPDMPEPVAKLWMQTFISRTIKAMDEHDNIRSAVRRCNDARFVVLISMAYQLGVNGLSQFHNTLDYIAGGDFSLAAREMLDSRWYRQTSQRAIRLSIVMDEGVLHEAYPRKG